MNNQFRALTWKAALDQPNPHIFYRHDTPFAEITVVKNAFLPETLILYI
jgi:hypothetical protein